MNAGSGRSFVICTWRLWNLFEEGKPMGVRVPRFYYERYEDEGAWTVYDRLLEGQGRVARCCTEDVAIVLADALNAMENRRGAR